MSACWTSAHLPVAGRLTGTNKMHRKRRADGTLKEMDDVGRSMSADRQTTAKKKTNSGFGDQGDRTRAAKKR